MTAKFPGLAGGPPPMPPAKIYTLAHLFRHPNDPITRQRFEFRELAIRVRGFLSMHMSALRTSAARGLYVQGYPGEGKSEGCLVSALKAGFTVLPLSGKYFAGETEGASTKALATALDECVAWSAAHKCHMLLLLNDFDLSNANASGDEKNAHTINAQLLVDGVMDLCDTPHLYCNFDGSPIPFIATVNDASGMRESLTRVGRAEWHDHVPTREDKANIAWAILAPQTSAERDLVKALVRKHVNSQPVAFWKALYHRMHTLTARPHLLDGMPDATTINRIYGQRLALTPDIAWEAAKQLRRARARVWLKKRTNWLGL